jgi:hypothetical protein
MKGIIKKFTVVTFFFSFASVVFAPSSKCLVIIGSQPVEPFKNLIHAIGIVETALDTLAYNPEEEATGYFQIRPVRVDDYNKRTGSNYSLNDMYNYRIAEKVFLYYASVIGPADFEKIAKSWNGSGPLTITYWDKVKVYL